MISTSLVLLALLVCLTFSLMMTHAAASRQQQRHAEISQRGECCQGRVLAVQRPFLFESTTRLYFEFAPPGAKRPVQCCHMERRPPHLIATALPSVGTFVTIRYLPECPEAAVIGKLVGELV